MIDPDTSQIRQKKETAYCKPADGALQQLLAGRHCYGNNNSCRNLYCDLGVCTGEQVDANCATHADCTTHLFCDTSKGWPYATTCTSLKVDGMVCE